MDGFLLIAAAMLFVPPLWLMVMALERIAKALESRRSE